MKYLDMNEEEEKEIDEILRNKPNVYNWRRDLTKITGGKDTGRRCLTVFVSYKVPKSDRKLMANKDVIPKEIHGIPTDVIELNTKDFEMGETGISRKPPTVQKRLAGGIRR